MIVIVPWHLLFLLPGLDPELKFFEANNTLSAHRKPPPEIQELVVLNLLETADESAQLKMCNDVLAVKGMVCLLFTDFLDSLKDLLELIAADAQ